MLKLTQLMMLALGVHLAMSSHAEMDLHAGVQLKAYKLVGRMDTCVLDTVTSDTKQKWQHLCFEVVIAVIFVFWCTWRSFLPYHAPSE